MATHRAPASEALSLLLSVNIAQDKEACRTNLERLGGVTALDHLISRELTSEANISCATILDGGLTNEQVILSQQRFGVNKFPNSKTNSFLHLLLAALSDSTLIILMMAATVSLIIGNLYLIARSICCLNWTIGLIHEQALLRIRQMDGKKGQPSTSQ
jgi:magnesium-transporting ATPase (P-type)